MGLEAEEITVTAPRLPPQSDDQIALAMAAADAPGDGEVRSGSTTVNTASTAGDSATWISPRLSRSLGTTQTLNYGIGISAAENNAYYGAAMALASAFSVSYSAGTLGRSSLAAGVWGFGEGMVTEAAALGYQGTANFSDILQAGVLALVWQYCHQHCVGCGNTIVARVIIVTRDSVVIKLALIMFGVAAVIVLAIWFWYSLFPETERDFTLAKWVLTILWLLICLRFHYKLQKIHSRLKNEFGSEYCLKLKTACQESTLVVLVLRGWFQQQVIAFNRDGSGKQ